MGRKETNDKGHPKEGEYWKKCWPGSEKIHTIRIDKLFEKVMKPSSAMNAS